MTEHFFLLHAGHLNTAKIAEIVEPLGAWHMNHTETSGEKRGWFCCRNRGNPHDRQVEREVRDAIEAAGGLGVFLEGGSTDED